MKLQLFLVIGITTNILFAEPHLFKKFPSLQNHIPHVALCDLPTPIVKLDNFGNKIGCTNLFMKRDDLSGKRIDDEHLYGGNKPRKLEFLLADAMAHGAQTIITYGCAGSNHALATAVYAQDLGLQSILMLKPQPNSPVVRQNLLLDHLHGAQLHFFPNNALRTLATKELLDADPHAYLIPTGGSNTIGVLGFVNAALELADQVKSGVMLEPDLLYIATGSCASVAGLLLGLQMEGLKTHVVAVCVEPEDTEDAFLLRIKELFASTNALLHTLDASIPLMKFLEGALIVNKKFCGTEYGLAIPEGIEAMQLFKETENIVLDGTYSARPIAALMDDSAHGVCDGKTVLFWNTYCGLDFSEFLDWGMYTSLPEEFRDYFRSAGYLGYLRPIII